jgi:hypothetical protein
MLKLTLVPCKLQLLMRLACLIAAEVRLGYR